MKGKILIVAIIFIAVVGVSSNVDANATFEFFLDLFNVDVEERRERKELEEERLREEQLRREMELELIREEAAQKRFYNNLFLMVTVILIVGAVIMAVRLMNILSGNVPRSPRTLDDDEEVIIVRRRND